MSAIAAMPPRKAVELSMFLGIRCVIKPHNPELPCPMSSEKPLVLKPCITRKKIKLREKRRISSNRVEGYGGHSLLSCFYDH